MFCRLNKLLKNSIFLVILLSGFTTAVVAQEEIPADFDHDSAKFILSGAHLKVDCKVCHVRNVYKGIPVACEECHSTSSLIAKTKKPNEHFDSVESCDNCHKVDTWIGARIDHDSVIGTCIDCHNNIVTTGRTSDHIQSVDECQECHTTRCWKQSGFDHEVITGNCYSCHNGSTAKGKSKKHRLSSNECHDCHHVKNWKSKTFDHKGIKSGCLSCHQNILPALPHPENNKCEECHSTEKKWPQVRFKHEGTSEMCINCHGNKKSVHHFIVTSSVNNRCDDCHRSTSSWVTNLRYNHEVADYQEHRANTKCVVCHLSNSSAVLWQFAAYKPKCAGCHASNFNTTSHVKASGTYTVSELADCTGSCHLHGSNYHSATRGRGMTAP